MEKKHIQKEKKHIHKEIYRRTDNDGQSDRHIQVHTDEQTYTDTHVKTLGDQLCTV